MNAQRVMIAVLLCGLSPQIAGAAPWRGAAVGRGGLPAVEVELGYPDGYVSTLSCPVVLRIRSGDRGFDGHVGFRFGQPNRMTIDTPVMTRLTLAPRSEHVFSTWTHAPRFGAAVERALATREAIVEWRDVSLDLIATASTGMPPWQSPRPLVLPSSVSTDAKWYGGFSSVVSPLDHWLALPMAVREAIFRSGTPVVFFGAPETLPELSPIDRALLPVEFRAVAMTLDIPWPYATAESKTVTVPISWRAKPQTRIVGSRQLPYLVSSAIATFSADEAPIRAGLPSFRVFVMRDHRRAEGVDRSFRVSEILREYRPLIVSLLLLPLPIIGWIAMRRRPRLVIVVSIAAIALLMIIVRDSVRASAGRNEASVFDMHAPGVVDRMVAVRESGPGPIRAVDTPIGNSITWGINSLDAIEVRTQNTLPGFGAIESGRGWDSRRRVQKWRELSTPATIHARPSTPDSLTVEYASENPVHYVYAMWFCGTRRCGGVAAVDSQKRGTVTVKNGTDSWSCLHCRFEEMYEPLEFYFRPKIRIDLITDHGDNRFSAVSYFVWPEDGTEAPYSVSTVLEQRGNILTGAFALLSEPAAGVNASVSTQGLETTPHRFTLTGSAGTLTAEGNPDFSLLLGELRRIAPGGGIVTLTVEPPAPLPPGLRWRARLHVERKKP